MEEDKITIICPQCRKKTRVSGVGLPTRTVKCATCQFKGSLMLFQIDTPKTKPSVPASNTVSRGAATVIEPVGNYQTSSPISNNGATIIENQPQAVVTPSMGYLQVKSTNQKYILKQGVNVIGRQHPTSQASIQIATNDGYMSRQHMRIDVLSIGNQLEYRICDNNSTNKLMLNGKQLNPGDIVVLRSGDRITIGHTDLLFMI